MLQLVKKLNPEEIAAKLKGFDPEVCTEVFLSELNGVLPTPEQVHHRLLLLIRRDANRFTYYRKAN
jgi:hypothetical protein